ACCGRGKGRLSAGDLKLWRAVAARARPLPGRTLPEAPVEPPDAPPPPEPAPPARRLAAKTRAAPPAPSAASAVDELAHGRTAGVDRRQAERLSRGRDRKSTRLNSSH